MAQAKLRKIGGVAGVKKRNPTIGDTVGVRVIDGKTGVELVLGCCSEFVEMTPAQAREIAACLVASANRMDPHE